MDAQRIEEEFIIERYVAGALSEEEETEFEVFLLENPNWLERVRLTEDLGRGTRGAAAEELKRKSRRRRFAPFFRLKGFNPALAAAAVLCPLLLAAAPPFVLVQVGWLTPTTPQINAVVRSVGSFRSQAAEAETIILSGEPQWFMLRVILDDGRAPEPFRAELVDDLGNSIWRGEGLMPSAENTLRVSFHSSGFRPERVYSLQLHSTVPGPSEIEFRVVFQD